jgi:tetraacyldisaccharide 4'-kinase
MSFSRLFLLPFSPIYGLVTWGRNKLFDLGLLPSKKFDVPVIGVGNLNSGGSGKTPMIEYLAAKFKESHNVAVLSRGYKRKSWGFRVADLNSSVKEIGDEALQVYSKNPEIVVAVNGSRVLGIKKILKFFPKTNIVLLDDSFQHRYVKPGLNLMLTHYKRMFYSDFLLPVGNLREYKSGVKRANAILVTNTPQIFSPLDKKLVLDNIRKFYKGEVFFSTVEYQEFVPLFLAEKKFPKKPNIIFLFTGIASTVSLENHLNKICKDIIVKKFPDHYSFKEKDLLDLKRDFLNTYGHSKVILVTEKDAMRLLDSRLMEIIKRLPIFYLPIKVRFQGEDEDSFNKLLANYLAQ